MRRTAATPRSVPACALTVLLGLLLAVWPTFAAVDPGVQARLQEIRDYRQTLKRFQHQLLTAGARARFESGQLIHRRARHALTDRAAMQRAADLARLPRIASGVVEDARALPGGFVRARAPRDTAEAGGAQGTDVEPSGVRRIAFATGAHEAQINDHRSDVSSISAQSEVTLAAWGNDVIAAWNDGETPSSPGPVGYGISRDGGRTWIDAGSLPIAGGVAVWTSDPVLTVNERTGAFYLAALVTSVGPRNAIAIVKGVFADSGLVWGIPTVTRAVRDTLPDKPWIAADSLSGHLYLAYTSFTRKGLDLTDQIEFIRSTDDNLTWSAPLKLSVARDDGLVQGARPAVGPEGEVHVVWGAVDTTDAAQGLDFVRVRTSRDGGASFGEQYDVADMYSNFGSGAPGFNRGYGIAFPSIAVDRSRGPWRGRVYVGWQETLNYYDDVPAINDGHREREPNHSPDVASDFEIGQTIRGEVISANDIDYLGFEGRAGQTVVFYMDSLDASLNSTLRLLCKDGETRLAYNSPVWEGRGRFLYHTLAADGRYFLRVAPNAGTGGSYRVRTGLIGPGPERARDHRDVFVAHSDDGRTWSRPARVNDDPGRFDNWLPEVAVTPDGRPYAAWYDWRDGPDDVCGGWSHVYLARSDDAGRSWINLGPSSTQPSDWTRVRSNLEPNQGDYIGLFAGPLGVRAVWADGRFGTPDVFTSIRSSSEDPPLVTPLLLRRVHPNPTPGALVVEMVLARGTPATLELYDLAGRRVAVRAVHPTSEDRHVERFDAGANLRAGIYLLRLRQGPRTASQRVAIVR